MEQARAQMRGLVAIALAMVAGVILLGCEEAAPKPPQAAGAQEPTAPPAAPATQVVELVIAAAEPQTAWVEQVAGGAAPARTHTVTFPDGFNAAERHNPDNPADGWFWFVSKPIPNVVTNAEVLRMSGISLDNGNAWYLTSLEITPELRVSIRAVLGDRDAPGASATLVVTIHANDTLDHLVHYVPSSADARAIVLEQLATNAIRLRLVVSP